LWDNLKKSENKTVINIVVMIDLHTVRCAELNHISLLCHVTEHTTFLRDVTLKVLTFVLVFRRMYCHTQCS